MSTKRPRDSTHPISNPKLSGQPRPGTRAPEVPVAAASATPAASPRAPPPKKKRKGVPAPLPSVAVEQPNWKRLQAMLRGGASGGADASAGGGSAPQPPAGIAQATPPPLAAEPPSGHVAGVPITDKLGLDCEMVGVGADGERSILARVVLVNWDGSKIYDSLVLPRERVTDFRTWVTGLTMRDLKLGRDFFVVQREVAELIRSRMLVGHALHNDLSALMLSHPKHLIRDTSQYVPLRTGVAKGSGKSHPRALRKLALEQLGMEIQTGAHDPTEDAVASLLLYRKFATEWEKALRGGSKARAAIIRGAKVKRKALKPEQRLVQDARKKREMEARALAHAAKAAGPPSGALPSVVAVPSGRAAAGASPAVAADRERLARLARLEAALPAPREIGRSRPAFLH